VKRSQPSGFDRLCDGSEQPGESGPLAACLARVQRPPAHDPGARSSVLPASAWSGPSPRGARSCGVV